jgi:hypothetical protein
LRELCSILKIGLNVLTITFHAKRKNAKLKHVKQWLNLFANYYNKIIT